MNTQTHHTSRVWLAACDVALTLALFGVLLTVLPATAAPIMTTSTITVANTSDSGAGSLRQAIADAGIADTIVFSAGLSGGMIMLATPLTITKDLIIDGAGLTDPIRISGSNAQRVFFIAGGNVTMANLVVQEGRASGTGACTAVNNGGSCGGGIYAASPLTLTHMNVLSNTAVNGGGIASYGPLTVLSSTITQNRATGSDLGGGGIFVSGATAVISGTTISYNRSTTDDGGGITMDYATSDAITITNSIIEGNNAADDGGGLKLDDTVAWLENTQFLDNEAAADGGAMHLDYQATITLVTSALTGNSAGDDGGAIYNAESSGVVISNTLLDGNTAIVKGGSLYNEYSTGVAISAAAFVSNTAGVAGGAIYNDASTPSNTLLVDRSTFDGNRAAEGGAVRSLDVLHLSNSTFYDNAATNAIGDGGGALHLMGTAYLTNTTIFSNSAPGHGGGVRISSASGTFSFANVIAARNSGDQCSTAGGVFNGVSNLATDASCGANFIQVGDALLGELGDYGGNTETVPLLPGSPATDTGDDATCLLSDQRGVARPQGSVCDIGAFESQGFVLNKTRGDNQATTIGQHFALPLVIAVISQSWQGSVEPVDGGVLLFTAPISGASVTFAPTTTQVIAAAVVSLPVTANASTGSYAVTVSASGAPSQTFAMTNTLPMVSVAVTSMRNPSIISETVTFTATVAEIDPVGLHSLALMPTGNVTFVDENDVTLAVAPLVDAAAVFTKADWPAGVHTVTATYVGDLHYAPGVSAPYQQVVQPLAVIYLPMIRAYGTGRAQTVAESAPPAPVIESAAHQLYLPMTAH